MLLILITACLLLFLTYFSGSYITALIEKAGNISLSNSFFDHFIFGLVLSLAYFNLCSLAIPLNFYVLIPLFLIAIYEAFYRQKIKCFINSVQSGLRVLFKKQYILITILLGVLLLVAGIIPPLNWDSGEYHYISIRWYESYKLVPGLANLHGRYAFNPATFVLSAPYSFTDIFGQALYPLNYVIACLFYAFILKTIYTSRSFAMKIALFISTIILLKVTLGNISSPSPDMLAAYMVFYCTYLILKGIINNNITPGYIVKLLIFIAFAVTVKITTVLLGLSLFLLLYIALKKGYKIKQIFVAIIPLLLIILPFLVRNVVMSGYLFYPIVGTNFFNLSYEVPPEVIRLDYVFCKFGPTQDGNPDYYNFQTLGLADRVRSWFILYVNHHPTGLIFTLIAFFSAIPWLLILMTKRKRNCNLLFVFWTVLYLSLIIWFISSPEFRFGISYVTSTIFISTYYFANKFTFNVGQQNRILLLFQIFVVFVTFHYLLFFQKHPASYNFMVQSALIKPLKDVRYKKTVDFPFVVLQNGEKLYIPNEKEGFSCVNAEGPCMNWPYGRLKMRGNKIEDGFILETNEVEKNFPYVNILFNKK